MARGIPSLAIAGLLTLSAFTHAAEQGVFDEIGRGVLRGRVLNAFDGGWLQGVNVLVDSPARGTATDFYGYYEVAGLLPGVHRVLFSYMGHADKRAEVAVASACTVRLDEELDNAFPPLGTNTGFGTYFARVPTRREMVRSLIRGFEFTDLECSDSTDDTAAVRRDNERRLLLCEALRTDQGVHALRQTTTDSTGRRVVRKLVVDGWWSRYLEEAAGGRTAVETPDRIEPVYRHFETDAGRWVELPYGSVSTPRGRLQLKIITSRRDTLYF